MIIYFSGTGNSEYVANEIGQAIDDEVVNLFERIRNKDYSSMTSDKPWIVVTPTYAWRIPRIVNEWLMKTKLEGNKEIYFVMTCGGSIGNANRYLEKLSLNKGMHCKGTYQIVLPENYTALYSAPDQEEALTIIKDAKPHIDDMIKQILNNQDFPQPLMKIKDKVNSGLINNIFYPLLVHAKKFSVTDACIKCGKCERVCPLQNIVLEDGKPIWGHDCTHCMACINQCPKEAIEYGKKTQGKVRYTFPKQKDI